MNIIDFVELTNQILIEHNKIRVDPRSYIPYLEAQKQLLKDKILYRPNEVPIETNEGQFAYEEAIEFLKKQKPLETLTHDERIAKACMDHAGDLGKKGLVSHDSSHGKSVSERIEAYCEWEECCAENLDFGTKTGRDVIISLLIDDGVEDRGHRENMFKEGVKFIGIACTMHKEYETVIVINYVGGIRDLGKPFFDPKTYKYEFPKDLATNIDSEDFHFNEKKEEKTINKIPKNSFQLADEDAPNGTVSCKTIKNLGLFEGRVRRTTKKIYTLENGKQHIVEVEDY